MEGHSLRRKRSCHANSFAGKGTGSPDLFRPKKRPVVPKLATVCCARTASAMDLASPRQRKRWDALSPPKIAVLELAEDESGCADAHNRAAPSHSVASLSHSVPRVSATHIPPLGLGRMRSSDVLLSALSARERSSACAATQLLTPQPLTARPLGVTPRNSAMLGPRTDTMIRDVEFGWSAPSKAPQATEYGHAPRTPRSPRGTRGTFTQPPQRSDAAARRGESHPLLLSRRAAMAPANDWALAPSDAHAWLHQALGHIVEIRVEVLAEPQP